MSGETDVKSSNVYQKPLYLFSKSPPTGFYRDGFCRVGHNDAGNHSVAGVLTDEFLDFTASKGNNLKSAGLSAGCKWCLCAARWKEAFDARKSDDDPVVPRVHLHATSERALDTVAFADLKKFAAEGENTTGTVRRGVQNPAPAHFPSPGGPRNQGGDN